MAFSTSNVQSTVFGNMHITYGQWSGAVGDAAGSITVSGGQVWGCFFVSQDSSGAYMVPTPVKYSVSGTAGVLTVTIYNITSTTAGRFMVFST